MPKSKGVVIERRGSKAGHVYELLGAVLGGEIVVEPYLITLQNDAEAYTGFRHAGTELIYMLTGEVIYRHSEQDVPAEARRHAALRFRRAARARDAREGPDDLSFHHHLPAGAMSLLAFS